MPRFPKPKRNRRVGVRAQRRQLAILKQLGHDVAVNGPASARCTRCQQQFWLDNDQGQQARCTS